VCPGYALRLQGMDQALVGAPQLSVKKCLNEAGLSLSDIFAIKQRKN
jgi:hypothetical protein